jgi:F0F1-type ATP synthase gamma subunit
MSFFSFGVKFHTAAKFLKKIVADFQRFSEKITKICIVFTTFLSSMYRNLVVFLELLSQNLVIFGFN